MAYSQEVIDHLSGLVLQLGDVNVLNRFPETTIREAMAFPDAVVGVTKKAFLIELPGIVGGYTVFDHEFNPMYTVEAPQAGRWGDEDIDVGWLIDRIPFGHYFYVAYDQEDQEELDGKQPRILMVLRA